MISLIICRRITDFSIIACFLFCSFSSICQNCLSQGIVFDSQSDIDDFPVTYPGCTNILGNVNIGFLNPTDISDLEPLSQITSIGGNLTIFNNPDLADFIGLDNVDSIGGFFSIDQNNISLTSLNGLESLNSIGGYLSISNNNGLSSLSGLDSLERIGSYLEVSANASLLNLEGLNHLKSINGYLRISGNDTIENLSGIDSIDHTSITNLLILTNPSLSICNVESVCNYLEVESNTAIINLNTIGCNTRLEIESSCLGLLPVELSFFKAMTSSNRTVLLEWETKIEVNFEEFEVQRSSNGFDWIKISSLNSQGETGFGSEYRFEDKQPLEGENYYRLKMSDKDSSFKYSETVVAFQTTENSIAIYPNPSTDIFNIIGIEPDQMKIEIRDNLGNALDVIQPSNQIDLSNTEKGIYFISIRTRYNNFNFKVIKK